MSGYFKRSVVSEALTNPLTFSARRWNLYTMKLHIICAIGSPLSLRAAAMTLRTVLLSLQALLAAAEPDDPQDAVVANQVRQTLVVISNQFFLYLQDKWRPWFKRVRTFKMFLFFSFSWHSQYKQNPEMFKQTATLWSHVYAGAPGSSLDYTRKIDKLCAMGFDKVCIFYSIKTWALYEKVILRWFHFIMQVK